MKIYVEQVLNSGVYNILDTFLNEKVVLNTKTTYTQDITAVFKGFTNNFSVEATPNNVRNFNYFGYTEHYQPATVELRAKLYILESELYREGIVKLQGTSWINGSPSLFDLEFSDGKKNLTETLGDDTFADILSGDIIWSTKSIQSALQSIQTGSDGIRWFIPLLSTQRIFSIYKDVNTPQDSPVDNIGYNVTKPITSENVLLPAEVKPAMFVSEILNQINKKYDIQIDPTPYVNGITQLTDLCVLCAAANVAVQEYPAKVTKSDWDIEQFREERFDILIKPNSVFELNYIGYGSGSAHDATFGMIIQLAKTTSKIINFFGVPVITYGTDSDKNYVNSIEVWQVNALGEKIEKLKYEITEGSETRSSKIKIYIGLDVFFPEGGNQPSTAVKPLISVFVSADSLADWNYTNISFDWNSKSWNKGIINNVQSKVTQTTVNLFQSLPEMKLIDFVKSIYTMFGYKKFKDKVLNDFYYTEKTVDGLAHRSFKTENDLTPFADLSKVTKKTNTKYDGYDLKHFTSEYQQNVLYANSQDMEFGQLKYPLPDPITKVIPKPKSPFTIETKFTAPVLSPVASDADTMVFTFYPFGSSSELNEAETRYIFEANAKELPIFYYTGVKNISTPYAFVDTDSKTLKSIGKYHGISHRSTRIKTGADNYITTLFNIVQGDYIDQNTLYVQDYKEFIEDTLSGKKLIHSVNLELPNNEIQKFEDSQEIIIKETKFTVMESDISLTDGKTKLTLLNK